MQRRRRRGHIFRRSNFVSWQIAYEGVAFSGLLLKMHTPEISSTSASSARPCAPRGGCCGSRRVWNHGWPVRRRFWGKFGRLGLAPSVRVRSIRRCVRWAFARCGRAAIEAPGAAIARSLADDERRGAPEEKERADPCHGCHGRRGKHLSFREVRLR